MNLLVRSIFGRQLRGLGRRQFAAAAAAPTEEYAKRNYANNVSEYNTVITSVFSQRRYYLVREVWEDMRLDGVQPTRDTFHALIIGMMKGNRLQDAFFFRDQMKAMGLIPDIALYNLLISTCGKSKNSDQALQVFEEMKNYDVKPSGQTFVCLLNAFAVNGQLDRVYAIVRDMTAAGVGLNKFCYAGLITAHMNKKPIADDTATKIIKLVEQSKGWSDVEAPSRNAQTGMFVVPEEELYNLPTADYANRARFLDKQLTVYHVGFHACAELRNLEAMETFLRMLEKDGKTPDVFITIQMMRCYLHLGDFDHGHKIFEDYINSGKALAIELYTTFVEGAMTGYNPKGMQLAQDALVAMNSRNFFLSPKMGSDLLLVAAGEKTGGYTVANYIWDLMQARRLTPSMAAVEAYYMGLKERDVPQDDPRLSQVSHIYEKRSMLRQSRTIRQ